MFLFSFCRIHIYMGRPQLMKTATIILVVFTLAMAMIGPIVTSCEGFGVTMKDSLPTDQSCPASHPYSFNGQGIERGYCCRTASIQKSMVPQDFTERCADDDYVRCPNPPCKPKSRTPEYGKGHVHPDGQDHPHSHEEDESPQPQRPQQPQQVR